MKPTSKMKIEWTPEMLTQFSRAKEGLRNRKSISVPRPDDKLFVYPDYSLESHSGGGWLRFDRVQANGKVQNYLGGHFSIRLPKTKYRWQACEGEALVARLALEHWSPYLIQAKEKTIVFADNEPVVKAFQKMKRGILSNSSRVAAFLIGTGQYNVDFLHTAGKTHFAADFNSRNAPLCTAARCQICEYAFDLQNTSVKGMTNLSSATTVLTILPTNQVEKSAMDFFSQIFSISVDDVLNGKVTIPY